MKEKATNVEIATITTTLGFMQAQLAEIKADVKNLNNTFASKEELATIARDNQERILRLEKASNLWKWISPTMSAILAAILAFFITAYFIK